MIICSTQFQFAAILSRNCPTERKSNRRRYEGHVLFVGSPVNDIRVCLCQRNTPYFNHCLVSYRYVCLFGFYTRNKKRFCVQVHLHTHTKYTIKLACIHMQLCFWYSKIYSSGYVKRFRTIFSIGNRKAKNIISFINGYGKNVIVISFSTATTQ